MSKNPIRFP